MIKKLIRLINRDPVVDKILKQIDNKEWIGGHIDGLGTPLSIMRSNLKIYTGARISVSSAKLCISDKHVSSQFSLMQTILLWHGGIKQLVNQIRNDNLKDTISDNTKQFNDIVNQLDD